MEPHESFDVVVVGAGAAGVGIGIVLRELGVERFTLLERTEIGASFARWPAEMRFITPSFPSNGFRLLDLNAVALDTSPATGLQTEHPSGPEYATYLRTMAEYFQVPVRTGVEVQEIVRDQDRDGFIVVTDGGAVFSRFVVWAAGEFQYPWTNPFPGAEQCVHTATIRSYAEIVGDEITVIGGYESGMDAAINLVALGKRVRVIDGDASWESTEGDPSLNLSPYTRERLRGARATGCIELIGGAEVAHVERTDKGYVLHDDAGVRWETATPPLLATGFVGSIRLVSDLFDWHAEGHALLTPQDESTATPGLFLVGPAVRHEKVIFCFIYKFRQRFAVVADAIGARLGLDPGPLAYYRANNMFLEDLSCCDGECVC